MDQVSMAVYTPLLIPLTRIEHRPVSQHSASFIGDVEDITMAFKTLRILEGFIGLLAVFSVIVLVLHKVYDHILYPMEGFGIKKLKGIVGGRQMTIHAVGHKPLFIVGMGGRLPGVVGKLYFMTARAELGRGRTDHGVIGEAEKGKRDKNAQGYQDGRF
jgi:hypothetical protein